MRQNRLGASGCQIGSKADYQVSNMVTCIVALMQRLLGDIERKVPIRFLCQLASSICLQHLQAAVAARCKRWTWKVSPSVPM